MYQPLFIRQLSAYLKKYIYITVENIKLKTLEKDFINTA